MKEILNKISSYNLFNNLLPGILFVYLSKEFTEFNFIQDSELIGAFVYYFIGMVISRFGSLIIEPILKYFSIIKFKEYNYYFSASKKDEKLELFLEINNTFRTITALFVILLLLKLYGYFQIILNIPTDVTSLILIISGLIIFIFSFRKQTNYISKRIDANNDINNE